MERTSLRLTVALGLLITVLGSTGIFAVFTDRAFTGENNVTSGPLPRAAELKVAPATEISGEYQCDRNEDGQIDPADATSPWLIDNSMAGHFDVTDLQPGNVRLGQAFCLHNSGSATLALTVTAPDVISRETGCTGDEQAAGDPDCGMTPDGSETEFLGELDSVLVVDLIRVECVAQPGGVWIAIDQQSGGLPSFVGTPLGLGSLAPGETTCIQSAIRYPSETPADLQQQAQSDRVSWQFAFDGVAS